MKDYFCVFTFAFDFVLMVWCFYVKPKKIKDLNLVFICMWLQFINTLAVFLLFPNSPGYLVTIQPRLSLPHFLSPRSEGGTLLHVASSSPRVYLGPHGMSPQGL